MALAKDKFWIFGVKAHEDDAFLGRSKEQRFSWHSRITPAEAALMLDVPNMIMVNCDGIPVPFSDDARGYAESFITMDSVLWSCTGSGGFRVGNEEKYICELAKLYPNIKGAFLDDFFLKWRDLDKETQIANQRALIAEIRGGLDKAHRPMDIYAVWYTYQTDPVDAQVLDAISGLSLWTWESKDLKFLPERFEKIEKVTAGKKKLLGIYMYDFPAGMPVTNDLMEFQCEFGLDLLKQGRIDGMIFESNSVMGVGLPSDYWLRDWVKKVKNTEVPD